MRICRRRCSSLALVAWLLALPPAAIADDCGAPAAKADNWPVAAPRDAALDPAVLCPLGPVFASWKEANVHSVLVARYGQLVFERYFSGFDSHWGTPGELINFGPETRHDVRSITKSVTSLLLGIVIGKGEITGADARVLSFFPEYADLRTPEKEQITLRDLLTMSAGLKWDENMPYSNPQNSEIQMDYAPDPYRYVLEQPSDTPPGSVYNYSGGSAALISKILQKATGEREDALAQHLLFDPLGIRDVDWVRYKNGDPIAASGLSMRPRDLAKLGQLVLDHGSWKGRQVVPAEWIEASTTPQINGSGLYFYGYQWWLGRSFVHGREVDWSAGVGYGGQRLFIVPTMDLVVVVTAGLYSSDMQVWVPLRILNRYVLASVQAR
jgi:CubicO group peptidase (beta-lactamase class C family)